MLKVQSGEFLGNQSLEFITSAEEDLDGKIQVWLLLSVTQN